MWKELKKSFKKNFPWAGAVLSGAKAWLGEFFTTGSFDKAGNAANTRYEGAYAENTSANSVTRGARKFANAAEVELRGVLPNGPSPDEQAREATQYAKEDQELAARQAERRLDGAHKRQEVRDKYQIPTSERDAAVLAKEAAHIKEQGNIKAKAATALRVGDTPLNDYDIKMVNGEMTAEQYSNRRSQPAGFPTKNEMTKFLSQFSDSDLKGSAPKPKVIESITVKSDGKAREYLFKKGKCTSVQDVVLSRTFEKR